MLPIIAMTCPSHEDGFIKAHDDYINAVLHSGGMPFIVPPCTDDSMLYALLKRADGLVLTGGCDVEPSRYGQKTAPWCGLIDQGRDHQEYCLVRAALEMNLPVMCICRGIQVLNCALGGTLYQDIHQEKPGTLKHDAYEERYLKVHEISVLPGSFLHRSMGEKASVNSCHHQAIHSLGYGLTVSATAPDGIIEGVEMANRPVFGVQWHPERLYESTSENRHLFESFIALCVPDGEHLG